MDLKDLILTPLYLFLIYIAAFIAKPLIGKKYPVLKKYLVPALTVRIIGALFVGLIYQFYYNGGDTFNYFTWGSNIIWEAFLNKPADGFTLIMATGNEIYPDLSEYTSRMIFYGDPPSYFIVRLSALLGIFSFHTYAVNSLLFSLIGFSGSLVMYTALYRMYPHLQKQLAIAVFFIPSVFFWGSGLLKDTITLSALGWAFYAFTNIFLFKKRIKFSIIIMIISIYVLKSVKVYILLTFMPALCIWLFLRFNHNIKSPSTRNFLKPFLLFFAIFLGIFAGQKFTEENDKYKLENIVKTSTTTSSFIKRMSEEQNGSGYDLGEMDPTIIGFLKKFPQGVWVTIFRPYLWESKNINMLFSAAESTFILLLTLLTLYRTGPIKFISAIRNDHYLVFAFIFSLTFAFAVGVSTFNFGTLVRYKIPMLPFFVSAIYIIKETADSKIRAKKRRLQEQMAF